MMPSSKRSWTKKGFREIMDWIDIKIYNSVNLLKLTLCLVCKVTIPTLHKMIILRVLVRLYMIFMV